MQQAQIGYLWRIEGGLLPRAAPGSCSGLPIELLLQPAGNFLIRCRVPALCRQLCLLFHGLHPAAQEHPCRYSSFSAGASLPALPPMPAGVASKLRVDASHGAAALVSSYAFAQVSGILLHQSTLALACNLGWLVSYSP